MDASPQLVGRCPRCFGEVAPGQSCAWCQQHGAPSASPLALTPGTLLGGQYRIGRMLGEPGGFGITYLAWDERLETRVAVKEFFPREVAGRGTDRLTLLPHTERDRSTFEYGLQEFIREARRVARFDHPNIVRVRNFFEANGTGYLVMDYYPGQSLSGYLGSQPGERLAEGLALQVMQPVLDGLRAVHATGMLHRDIDPHNVYVTAQGRIILLDFGAARMAVGDRSRSLSVILKPGYAPYEQYATSGRQGPWTDVYACAATLYRVVTGQVPVDAPSRVMGERLAPADEVNPAVSRALGAVLERAMALRVEDRPQSAEELQTLLLHMAGADTGGDSNQVVVAGPAGADLEAPKQVKPWLAVGVGTYIVAWFVPVVDGGTEFPPGVEAFLYATGTLLDSVEAGTAGLLWALCFLSAQTNFFFIVFAEYLVGAASSDRSAEIPIPMWFSMALWAAATLNLIWIPLFQLDLRPGYFLWLASFGIMAVAARKDARSKADTAGAFQPHARRHWAVAPKTGVPLILAAGLAITLLAHNL